jgi:hypothetical protein
LINIIGTWNDDNAQRGHNLQELPQSCPSCRSVGKFYISKLNVEEDKWDKWKLHPDGIDVCGIHKYFWKDETYSRDYIHNITSPALMYAIHHHFGSVFGTTIRRPANVPDNLVAENIWRKYIEMNNHSFECRHCERQVWNIDKIRLIGCKKDCKYLICRDCFLLRITDDPVIPTKPRSRGFLHCPDCNLVAQAHYYYGKKMVANAKKKILK